MKTFPAALLTFLQSGQAYLKADLIQIALTNGQTFYVTDCQTALSYGGNIYSPSAYGAWMRGKIISEASFNLQANQMELTADVPATVLFPGTSIPLPRCVIAGLFDGALVTIYTAYWPANSIPNTFLGVETKFVGVVMNFQRSGRTKLTLVVGDLLYLLNAKVPTKVLQAGCRHVFGSSNCGFNLATVTSANSVAAGSTTQVINLGSSITAALYPQGFIKFTSGSNNGLTMAIKTQPSTTQIVLAGFTPLPLAIGDTFNITQGCNKTQTRCSQLFGIPTFQNHYGGQDYTPNPEYAA